MYVFNSIWLWGDCTIYMKINKKILERDLVSVAHFVLKNSWYAFSRTTLKHALYCVCERERARKKETDNDCAWSLVSHHPYYEGWNLGWNSLSANDSLCKKQCYKGAHDASSYSGCVINNFLCQLTYCMWPHACLSDFSLSVSIFHISCHLNVIQQLFCPTRMQRKSWHNTGNGTTSLFTIMIGLKNYARKKWKKWPVFLANNPSIWCLHLHFFAFSVTILLKGIVQHFGKIHLFTFLQRVG